MAIRVYMDTSVFSARLDERERSRQAPTEAFFGRLAQFEVVTSAHARRELERTPDPGRRAGLLAPLQGVAVLPLTSEAEDLARRYVEAGVFSLSTYGDALHVAAAVLARSDVLVSWSFDHLVNRRRRARVSQINVSWGFPQIDIVAPSEL
jgi:predicted nucleic acid-binding protein